MTKYFNVNIGSNITTNKISPSSVRCREYKNNKQKYVNLIYV